MTLRSSILLLLVACGVGCGGKAVIDHDDQPSSQKSSSSGGTGDVDIRVSNALARANCMPIPAADPLQLSFTARFENTGSGAVSITVIAARLTAAVGTANFAIDPSAVGPIAGGASQDVAFDKLPGTAVGTSGCDFCMSTDARLEVDLRIDAKTVPLAIDEAVDSISCVF